MFGLMKEAQGGPNMSRVSGSVLGARTECSISGLDAMSMALAQLSAYAFPQISGATMTALERVLSIEPNKKPELRKFITDSYAQPPSVKTAVRSFKRRSPRHDDSYRLALNLCHVAREAERYDKDSLNRVINAAKSLGLSKDEVLSVLQKAKLTA